MLQQHLNHPEAHYQYENRTAQCFIDFPSFPNWFEKCVQTQGNSFSLEKEKENTITYKFVIIFFLHSRSCIIVKMIYNGRHSVGSRGIMFIFRYTFYV
jgi:hypothetical protein